jgi:DDE family transposase
VHLTETCDEDGPHLISHAATTRATTPDEVVTGAIQASLAQRALLPREHYVDTGYTSAALLVSSATRYGIDLVGPLPEDTSWQGRADAGFAGHNFHIDWDTRTATCPQGKPSRLWCETHDEDGHPLHRILFDPQDCRACSVRRHCTHSVEGARTLTVHPPAEQRALEAARARQQTADFEERYHTRAGIEGTMAQGVHACGLRQCRYRGLAKTTLQHLATAAAINLQRLDDWWTETPRAKTRKSPFAALVA